MECCGEYSIIPSTSPQACFCEKWMFVPLVALSLWKYSSEVLAAFTS